MRWLERKVPPPVVAALTGAAMWAGARMSPQVQVAPGIQRAIAALFMVSGGAVALSGFIAFRRAQTTINPHQPEATSSLVVSGVYCYTRNPMYLGLACVLIGWAVCLASPVALAGPALFVGFITRFQIIPEERVLSAKFGRDFAAYQRRVRRWV